MGFVLDWWRSVARDLSWPQAFAFAKECCVCAMEGWKRGLANILNRWCFQRSEMLSLLQVNFINALMTVWPSGLRRWLKAPVRKGVGSNPTAVILHEDALRL